MARISKLKRDVTAVHEVEYGEGVFVSLRPMPNPEFDARMSNLRKPQIRRIRQGTFSDEERVQITKEAMAYTVVVGWRGIEDDDDQPVPYSPKQCLEYFNDPDLYDFYQFCRTEAADLGGLEREDEAEAVGN